MTWYIYAICEPDSATIRYVGKSVDPWARMYSHRSRSAASPVRKWMLSLAPLEARLQILQTIGESETEAMIAERGWIAKLRASGVALLNITEGGERSGSPRKLRFTGVGERIKSCRDILGWNQKRLAIKSGVDQACLSRIEAAERPNLLAENAVLLARALDVSVEWLVTGEERRAKEKAA